MTATVDTEIDVLDFEPAGSVARWETAVRDVPAPRTVRPLHRRGDVGRFRSRDVGDLQILDWDCSSLEGVLFLARDPQRDVVEVVADNGAEERLPFEGTDAPVVNAMVGLATDRDGVSVRERFRKRTLALPRAVLVAAGCDANIPACLVVEQGRPLAGVLLRVLDEAWSRVPGMNTSEVEATRGALVTLTAGVIRVQSGHVKEKSDLAALRAQIDDWITRNLRCGPIHIEDLAAAHSVSARTIHRAFSLTGDTMTAVVRSRRLAAVREELVHTNMTIAKIAHRWCFYDPSHLGREFRRCFGVSPTEYRQSHGC
ncbi:MULTISPECIES: helix-turn-helix transcriptional regulator [Rhodococcus]|uniref:helix-turn-helix transcriptional regulator n=1 Tax=Rhodococcus TaxID=1827 RepID=UPI000EA948A4|nr:AraC family transcriptional regulator [Rhodococcus opacus]NHU47652.1 AraC family transcriptional regulator [Rhodococcus sp. A14]QZS56798.1 AraC family transcriptional regulator [Rhodococcus opacus]RKM76573.1 AraC family transcriptional regulator [Rhodococcus opacus]UZG52800.1 AraC family transcriptional regulator [Rhodococcus opacus]